MIKRALRYNFGGRLNMKIDEMFSGDEEAAVITQL